NSALVYRGIGQQTTAQVLGRFGQDIAPLKPGWIILQAGINDLKAIPLLPHRKASIIADCKKHLGQMVELSKATGARVVVTTIFPLGEVPLWRKPFWSDDVAPAIQEVNTYLATLASERVIVFDTAKVLADPRGIVTSQYRRD